MAKFDHWRSPVADMGANFPKCLKALPFTHQWNIRVSPSDAAFDGLCKGLIGTAFPQTPNHVQTGTDGTKAIWLAPDEWLVVSLDDMAAKIAQQRKDLGAAHVALTDISANRIIFELSGPHPREILMKSCELDFHPRVFKEGQAAQTLLAKSQALIEKTDVDCFHIYVRNSFARYVAGWLCDAAREYDD